MEKTEAARWFVELHSGYGKNETVGETGPYKTLEEAVRFSTEDDLIFSSSGDRFTYEEAVLRRAAS